MCVRVCVVRESVFGLVGEAWGGENHYRENLSQVTRRTYCTGFMRPVTTSVSDSLDCLEGRVSARWQQ